MKKLKFKLSASIVILIAIIITLLALAPYGLEKIAQAYLNSYSKNSGEQLTASMWNNLDDDFGGGGVLTCQDFSNPTVNISGADYPLSYGSYEQMSYCDDNGYKMGDMIDYGGVTTGNCATIGSGTWAITSGCTYSAKTRCCK